MEQNRSIAAEPDDDVNHFFFSRKILCYCSATETRVKQLPFHWETKNTGVSISSDSAFTFSWTTHES